MRTNGLYLFRKVGTCGCEIIDPKGSVVAWTVDEAWAAIIVRVLNESEHSGVAVDAGLNSDVDQPPYNILEERN